MYSNDVISSLVPSPLPPSPPSPPSSSVRPVGDVPLPRAFSAPRRIMPASFRGVFHVGFKLFPGRVGRSYRIAQDSVLIPVSSRNLLFPISSLACEAARERIAARRPIGRRRGGLHRRERETGSRMALSSSGLVTRIGLLVHPLPPPPSPLPTPPPSCVQHKMSSRSTLMLIFDSVARVGTPTAAKAVSLIFRASLGGNFVPALPLRRAALSNIRAAS